VEGDDSLEARAWLGRRGLQRGEKHQGERHDSSEIRKPLAGAAAASVILAFGFAYAPKNELIIV
jgi:hypothetical protein